MEVYAVIGQDPGDDNVLLVLGIRLNPSEGRLLLAELREKQLRAKSQKDQLVLSLVSIKDATVSRINGRLMQEMTWLDA